MSLYIEKRQFNFFTILVPEEANLKNKHKKLVRNDKLEMIN
jgi:hypothetical protein